jgi:hypothetical protein
VTSYVRGAEGISATTPAGKLQMHTLGAIVEFERAPIIKRVRAGLARRVAQGNPLGRPRRRSAATRAIGCSPPDLGAARGTPFSSTVQKPALTRFLVPTEKIRRVTQTSLYLAS